MDTVTPDENGVVWSCAATGWDRPDTNETWDPKVNDHGALRGPSTSQPRDVTLTIWAECPDPLAIKIARLKFEEICEPNTDISVTALDDSEPIQWTATGNPYGKLLIKQDLPTQMDINLVVRCKDPRKYGPVKRLTLNQAPPAPGLIFPLVFPLLIGSQTAGNTAVNDGPVSTPPIIYIYGPFEPTFWVRNFRRQRRLAYNFRLASGDVLVINTRIGSVRLNGVSSRRGLQTPDSGMFFLDKGETQLEIGSSVIGAGYAVIEYSAARMA